MGIMEQISRSADEVSNALAPIFAKAVPHSLDELRRARDRRELGNPPGKSDGPIGDQLTWEQILLHFKGKKRLWIISRDGDYGTVYDGKGFLNRFLYDELCKVANAPEAYLFEDTVEGIKHFLDTTGVKAEKRLTPEETSEIKKEEKALPPLDWLSGNSVGVSGVLVSGSLPRSQAVPHPAFFASGELAGHPAYYQMRKMSPALLEAISSSGMISPVGVPPTDPKQTSGG
jgi:hypothetical protein